MDANPVSRPAEEDANDAVHELRPTHDSPSLAKRFGGLSLNAAAAPPTSPDKHSTDSPRNNTPHSPKSPGLSRKASNQSLRPPSRRTSSATVEERAPLTPASVASDYFKRELLHHNSAQDALDTDTLVLTHDSCYGHRFSRPRTSKTTLSLIFERPERLQAGVLGLASAYVHLGQRHAHGSHPPHPRREPDSAVPFRIQRTPRSLSVLSPYVTAVHGAKWMHELKSMCDAAGPKLAAGDKEMKRPETPTNGPPKPYLHEGDLYLCAQSLDAFEGALGGVCEAVDAVFQDSGNYRAHKKAFVCIRPPGHHCSADLPSGFCWINNVHVGIEYAAQLYDLTHAAIIDFDLHHGDGSQAIAWERNAKSARVQKSTAKNMAQKKTFVGYFSLHDINSYPCEEGDMEKVQRASVCIDGSHGQSVWNVHLQPYSTEAEFWDLYEKRYLVILDKTRRFLRSHTERLKAMPGAPAPKAAIFISAGFDASQWETPSMQRHKINVPTEFYARFTADIVRLAKEEGCSTDGRVISVLEGGYSDRALNSGVLSHLAGLSSPHNIVHAARQTSTPSPQPSDPASENVWNPAWWSDSTLTELENLLKPPGPPPPPKRTPRSAEPHSYQSPTQSFTAKAVDPAKLYRTFSAGHSAPTPPRSRPPSPPPPDVEWATAAHELSKLIIPSDRQVDSCKHEELNEPKPPKQKRERHSSIGIASVQAGDAAGEGRQTRGRKAKLTAAEQDMDGANRRQTVAEVPISASTDAAPRSRSASKPRQPSASRAGELKISKTRRASASRDELPQQGLMPAPPVPKVPKQHVARPSSRAGGDAPASVAPDVDALTSGVKKITLKLSKEDEKAASAQPAVKKAPRKPAAPRAPKAVNAKAAPAAPKQSTDTKTEPAPDAAVETPAPRESGPGTGAPSETPVETPIETPSTTTTATAAATATPSEPVKEEPPVPSAPTAAEIPPESLPAQHDGAADAAPQQLPAVVTAPSAPDVPPAQRPADTAAAASFVPYEPPAGPPAPAPRPAAADAPLTWLPPNVNTPVHLAGRKAGSGSRLPVFTSTGHIPFAVAPADKEKKDAGAPSGIPRAKAEAPAPASGGSLWDVPVSPKAE